VNIPKAVKQAILKKFNLVISVGYVNAVHDGTHSCPMRACSPALRDLLAPNSLFGVYKKIVMSYETSNYFESTIQKRRKVMKKDRKFSKPEDREKVLNDLVEKAKELKEGEKINATEFCNTHNIVYALFLDVYASATKIVENFIPHEFIKEKGTRSSGKKYAVVGERGNIIIKPPHVAVLNEGRDEDRKFKPGDKFEVSASENVITLTKI
jgi:hypothetical protein